MAWELTYDAPRGLRMNRGFWAITTLGGPWWCDGSKMWLENPPAGEVHSTYCHGPKTTRAFMRYLRKHPELKGVEVIFVHRGAYESTGLDITANWVE